MCCSEGNTACACILSTIIIYRKASSGCLVLAVKKDTVNEIFHGDHILCML